MKVERTCPVCGSIPIIHKEPLWRPSGGGYYGCYELWVECSNDGCKMHPSTRKYDTIYNSELEAREKAISDWNWRGEE